ncbi:MAG: hypothetical protein IJ218_03015 [Alphaproteobacteria bacterium]|nr:hypothetical protein [Alphaproteobacteria bacterium]
MKKNIAVENLNAIVANNRADKLVAEIKMSDPDFLADADIAPRVRLHKIVLREQAFDTPKGKNIYAFAKCAGRNLTILVDVKSGKAQLCPVANIVSSAPVKGKFVIDGTVYGLKDTLNGNPRYEACGSTHKPRAKALNKHRTMLDLAADKHDAAAAYYLEPEPGESWDDFDADILNNL